MNEIVAIVKHVFIENYLNFEGRATRKEFWYAFLAYFVVNLVFSIIPGWVGLILRIVWWLATLLPILSVGARRLHDINKEALYLLIGLIPIAGIIILIVWWAQEGDKTENQYGPVPEEVKVE